MTLRTVRPATINNTKLLGMLCLGVGILVLSLTGLHFQPHINAVNTAAVNAAAVNAAPGGFHAWPLVGMAALFSGLMLMLLGGKIAKRGFLVQIRRSGNLLVMPSPTGHMRPYDPVAVKSEIP